jgi:hypothetical protein
MDNCFSVMSKNMKQRAVTEFFMHENETHFRIHHQLLAFYGEDTVDIAVCQWVRKSRDRGRNLDPYHQPWPGGPLTATNNVDRQKNL